VDVEFVVIAEAFDGKSGEETVRAGEIGPGVEEERHRANTPFRLIAKL
jgi:hypothetical protein